MNFFIRPIAIYPVATLYKTLVQLFLLSSMKELEWGVLRWDLTKSGPVTADDPTVFRLTMEDVDIPLE